MRLAVAKPEDVLIADSPLLARADGSVSSSLGN
jgi:hypothetical protein